MSLRVHPALTAQLIDLAVEAREDALDTMPVGEAPLIDHVDAGPLVRLPSDMWHGRHLERANLAGAYECFGEQRRHRLPTFRRNQRNNVADCERERGIIVRRRDDLQSLAKKNLQTRAAFDTRSFRRFARIAV